MRTRVMDMSNEDDLEAVETAYYNLYSDDLRCVEQKTTPERSHLEDSRTIVVAAYKDGEIVGVTMVDDNWVLYPVMTGDYVEVLRALIYGAYGANGFYLKAYTDNQLILETAVEMGIGVTRDGNTLEFN